MSNNLCQQLNRVFYYLVIVLSVFAVVSFIFLSSFHSVLYNDNFYEKEFQKNNVYEKFSKESVNNATNELFGYIQGKNALTTNFFSERDKQHMVDVKELINNALLIYYVLFFVIVVLFVFLYLKHPRSIKTILFSSSILVIAFTIFCFLFRNYFDAFFIKFHETLFTNNLWLLNPATDNLINLFPGQFWYSITLQIFLRSAIAAVLLLLFYFILRHTKIFK